MMSTPSSTQTPLKGSQLPSYLSRHVNLGFDDDDVTALLSSIESSQRAPSVSVSSLPAELLLYILEYVPVDYILDWRLVCRGFCDAIDSRILFYHVQRTQLIGYMGSKHSRPLDILDEEDYNQIQLLHAEFNHFQSTRDAGTSLPLAEPFWSNEYAVFTLQDEWFQAFHHIGGASAYRGATIRDSDARWLHTLDRLELQRAEEGYGSLRWCIKLDHAVLDLEFPMEMGRNSFDIQISLEHKVIIVAWKEMMLNFLKNERALRLLLEQVRVDDTIEYKNSQLTSFTEKRFRFHLQPRRRLSPSHPPPTSNRQPRPGQKIRPPDKMVPPAPPTTLRRSQPRPQHNARTRRRRRHQPLTAPPARSLHDSPPNRLPAPTGRRLRSHGRRNPRS